MKEKIVILCFPLLILFSCDAKQFIVGRQQARGHQHMNDVYSGEKIIDCESYSFAKFFDGKHGLLKSEMFDDLKKLEAQRVFSLEDQKVLPLICSGKIDRQFLVACEKEVVFGFKDSSPKVIAYSKGNGRSLLIEFGHLTPDKFRQYVKVKSISEKRYTFLGYSLPSQKMCQVLVIPHYHLSNLRKE